MRFVVKRWGNGLAVRLPRNSAELGRLEEGMELEAEVKPIRNAKRWKPFTFHSGIPDLSVRHDELRDAAIEERWGHLRRKVPTS